MITWLMAAALAGPSVSQAMRSDLPDAAYVARYTPAQRLKAAQGALHMSARFKPGPAISLTPNQPYVGGARLEIWRPAFVLGTAYGGEAGFNFWGLHNQGHINIGFTSTRHEVRLLDCRIVSPEPVHYKLYSTKDTPDTEGDISLADGHLFLLLPAVPVGQPALIELWPQSETAVMGVFGCDLGPLS